MTEKPTTSRSPERDEIPEVVAELSEPSPLPAKRHRDNDDDDGTVGQYTQNRRARAIINRWKPWVKERFIEAFNASASGVWLNAEPPDLKLCQDILAHFPDGSGITAEEIQKYIERTCVKAKRTTSVSGSAIDKWIEVMEALTSDGGNIAKQLNLVMLVAKQEPADGVPSAPSFDPNLPRPNFAAIYEYLAKAYTSEPLPELTPIDSLVVEDLVQSLSFQIESLNDGELRKSLRKIYLHMAQDPNEEPEPDHDDMKSSLLHNATILNPLGINAEAIVPVVPK